MPHADDSRNESRPLRVVHVLGSLGRGGAEAWLAQIVRHLDRRHVQTDIIVNNDETSHYRVSVEEAGCHVFECRSLSRPFRYSREFLKVLRDNGPYDVVHGHLQLFNGMIVKLAQTAGVPVRIAHSRNARDGQRLTLNRWCYRSLMRHWIGRCATYRLAVSREAALGAFGPRWGDQKHCALMTGIDFSPFMVTVDPLIIRRSLGLPPGSRVIGHVGSFRAQKNHDFLIRVAAAMAERHADVRFLLVGNGSLLPEIKQRAVQKGLRDRFLFLGDRVDVPDLMLGGMDAFCLPSVYEGLPRVLLEAQAAGLPCVASDAITREVVASRSSVQFLRLDEPILHWCEALESALAIPHECPGAAAIADFEARGLTIAGNACQLAALYRELRYPCRRRD